MGESALELYRGWQRVLPGQLVSGLHRLRLTWSQPRRLLFVWGGWVMNKEVRGQPVGSQVPPPDVGVGAQIIRHGGKCFYPVGQPTNPTAINV